MTKLAAAIQDDGSHSTTTFKTLEDMFAAHLTGLASRVLELRRMKKPLGTMLQLANDILSEVEQFQQDLFEAEDQRGTVETTLTDFVAATAADLAILSVDDDLKQLCLRLSSAMFPLTAEEPTEVESTYYPSEGEEAEEYQLALEAAMSEALDDDERRSSLHLFEDTEQLPEGTHNVFYPKFGDARDTDPRDYHPGGVFRSGHLDDDDFLILPRVAGNGVQPRATPPGQFLRGNLQRPTLPEPRPTTYPSANGSTNPVFV